MKTVCHSNMCAGCGVCLESCAKNAIQLIEDIKMYNAVIDEDKCIGCGKCHKVCPKNHPSQFRSPIEWHQGWSADEAIRANSSSGGLATAIATAFIENGGIVCSCKLSNGQFGFHFIDNVKDITSIAGSKYVKSSPVGIYHDILSKLKKGQKVLFIGLPCQVSAVLNYVQKERTGNLYTIDLICHGTPSARLLDTYLQQYNVNIHDVSEIDFRENTKFNLLVHKKDVDFGVQDNYTTSFLTSMSYTENCYSCDYAQEQRVSDLTLGDSWGSDLAAEEYNKGISLVLCQTEKGQYLLEKATLCLYPVDLNRAMDANAQLKHPSIKPDKREMFFEKIKKGKSFNYTMFLIEPKREAKKIVKRLLARIKAST